MDIELIKIAGGLIIGVVIILVLKFMIELPFKIVWNSLIGAAILYVVNLTGLVAPASKQKCLSCARDKLSRLTANTAVLTTIRRLLRRKKLWRRRVNLWANILLSR